MKKILLFISSIITFISCNPEGTTYPEAGNIIGSYKISYILKNIEPISGEPYTDIINNNDTCGGQTTLTIDDNLNFIVKNFDLINTDCQVTEIDSGELIQTVINYGNPLGNMIFSNNSNKNTEYIARSINGIVTSFTFHYSLQNPTQDIQSISVEYHFTKI